MRHGKLSLIVATIIGMAGTPAEANAAEAAACVDQYLLCINDASQQDGVIYRTVREAECGLDYWSCLRTKATG